MDDAPLDWLIQEFNKEDDEEFLKFDRVQNPLNKRPDICAFLLLDSILSPTMDHLGGYNNMVACAEHDQIWLDVDVEELAKLVTPEQVRDLRRCGVMYNEDTDSLLMFV